MRGPSDAQGDETRLEIEEREFDDLLDRVEVIEKPELAWRDSLSSTDGQKALAAEHALVKKLIATGLEESCKLGRKRG